MEIRFATSDDTASLYFLRQERAVLLAQSDARLSHHITEPFETLLADPKTAVWVGVTAQPQHVAGYVVAKARLDDTGVITELTLDAHKYHGGLGRKLFSSARDWFKQQQINTLHVHVAQYHAVEQAFWRSLGAIPISKPSPDLHLTGLVWMQINL